MTCLRGHDAGRDSSGHCKLCRNEYKKAYYAAHKGKRNEQRRRQRVQAARRAEIKAAKEILMGKHRLRLIGVTLLLRGHYARESSTERKK